MDAQRNTKKGRPEEQWHNVQGNNAQGNNAQGNNAQGNWKLEKIIWIIAYQDRGINNVKVKQCWFSVIQEAFIQSNSGFNNPFLSFEISFL